MFCLLYFQKMPTSCIRFYAGVSLEKDKYGRRKHTYKVFTWPFYNAVYSCVTNSVWGLWTNVATPSTHTRSLHQSVSFNSCNIYALIYSPHLEREGEMSTIVSIYSSFRLSRLLPLSFLMHRGQHSVSHQGILTEFCCQFDVFATLCPLSRLSNKSRNADNSYIRSHKNKQLIIMRLSNQ